MQIKTNKYFLLAIDKPVPHDKLLQPFLKNEKWRVIIFADSKDDQHHHVNNFCLLHLSTPPKSDLFMLLKQHRSDLENFHHVIIPDEILWDAYSLAERYMAGTHALENALLLLDSSAARAGVLGQNVTMNLLTNVLSHWTHIPSTHLQTNQFKLTEFTQNMQQRLFGQDTAITHIGHGLQQSFAKLQEKTGPFCSFLFAGPSHVGKKTSALLLAEHLFKQLNTLFYVELNSTMTSLAEIKTKRFFDKRHLPLKQVIQQIPYAILVFDFIEEASAGALNALEEIVTSGYLHDADGIDYDFRQAIIILNTTLGTKPIIEFTQSHREKDESHDAINLMQLVLNQHTKKTTTAIPYHSTHELVQEMMSQIIEKLPLPLCHHLHVVPFFPLDKDSIENIICVKLKILQKQLDLRYGIELRYAPEVIRFLSQQVLLTREKENHAIHIDKTLKQQLYFCVEQTLLNQSENKNYPSQLSLQLNETGQLLRCEWLTNTAVRQHAP